MAGGAFHIPSGWAFFDFSGDAQVCYPVMRSFSRERLGKERGQPLIQGALVDGASDAVSLVIKDQRPYSTLAASSADCTAAFAAGYVYRVSQ